MGHRNILFQKVQQKISRHDFDNAAKSFLPPNSARTFTHRNHFDFLLFCILMKVPSLRAGLSALKNMPERLYHIGFKQAPKLSTVSDANSKRDWRVFEKLFFMLLAKTRQYYKNKFSFPLYILDSSAITFRNKHTEWAAYSKATDGIKVHVTLDGFAGVPVSAEITDGKVADITIFKKKEMQRGALYICDRAYWDAKYLHKQHRNGAFFIIRAKSNLIYKTLKEIPSTDPEGKYKESIIQLIGPNGQKYSDTLRAVQLHDDRKDENFLVLTNNKDLPAESIAALYKYRWQIELLFKWLKQNLKFDTLLGYSKNAVMSQIWVAMIAYLILWQLQQEPEYSDFTMLDFLRYLQARLFICDTSIRLQKAYNKNNKQLQLFQEFWE